MCIGIEYFLQDARHTVYFDSDRPELPVRLRGGAIGFYTWGARSRTYYAAGNVPGWGAKFVFGSVQAGSSLT
jgi:hypothetical protein